ncbi:TIGR03986 family type III CRISPR-associated RAMP protein [Coleofasciculus chthonoplastes]|uniref:TIGR03986 family type III CRISPR-associated RAMP protein n=1 Tax=Coleofasciculus chthonoplastes TaxID=64178 RepID=UPI0032F874E5
MLPKHLKKVPEDRNAIAPYNFVELPEKVVEAEPLPDNDRYCPNRHTGQIICTLITESPLYIRCALTPTDFANFGDKNNEDLTPEQRRKRADFFTNPANQRPTLPGSSLRGLLRTLVEIVSFGKLDQVSEQQRFFFRAVAADKDEPLKKEYEKYLDKGRKVKAGYLTKETDGWYIRPALSIEDKPFVWVEEKDLWGKITELIPMKSSDYRPQYKYNISFGNLYSKNCRRFAKDVSSDCEAYKYRGVLVTSGNMLEASDNPDNLQRKNYCLIREPDTNAELLKISDDAIEHYCHALTTFQKGKSPYEKNPFNENLGVLTQGRAIFYCQPQQVKIVTLFGQSPNFRIPFSFTGDGRAASAVDFIPDYLHNSEILDMAEAIFGYVRNEKQDKNQACAGRVFISDAICERTAGDDIWLKNDPITPKILASPKPTTFQHYLVQTDPEARKCELKHYANKPEKETVIRGHKLYWHKGCSPSIVLKDSEASESQTTQIKPIKAGVSFTFTIDFENLSDVELGAILWVLNIAQKEEYRLSIGMGKPLGMGAVKITHQLHLSDRKQRYKKLFQDNNWHIGEKSDGADTQDRCAKVFEKYALNHISEADQPNTSKATTLEELPRIKMLLAMLSWSGVSRNEARYMEIERDHQPRIGTDKNEYKERPVLPTPLQVIGWEDNRKMSKPNPSPKPRAKGSKPVLKKSKPPTRRNKEGGREDKGSGNPAFARSPKPPKRQ